MVPKIGNSVFNQNQIISLERCNKYLSKPLKFKRVKSTQESKSQYLSYFWYPDTRPPTITKKQQKKSKSTQLYCVRRESNPGPIETTLRFRRQMATMDFTTKPQTLLIGRYNSHSLYKPSLQETSVKSLQEVHCVG